MTAAFPALEATLIRPSSAPSMERPRLYVEGEILPALYHYVVRVDGFHYSVQTIIPAQHEIDAAKAALRGNSALREHAIGGGSVIVAGLNENGSLGEYPVTIRVDQDGAVAIPP